MATPKCKSAAVILGKRRAVVYKQKLKDKTVRPSKKDAEISDLNKLIKLQGKVISTRLDSTARVMSICVCVAITAFFIFN